MEGHLDQATTRLHEAMTNKDKLAKNFDETEKLYVDKIKSLQEEFHSAQEELDKLTPRFTNKPCFDIMNMFIAMGNIKMTEQN